MSTQPKKRKKDNKRTGGEHHFNLLELPEIPEKNPIDSLLEVNNLGILSEAELCKLSKEIEELCKPDFSVFNFEIEPIKFSD